MRNSSGVKTVGWSALCVPGMGMIIWSVSPLYIVWRGIILMPLKVLADGKGGRATERLKEA